MKKILIGSALAAALAMGAAAPAAAHKSSGYDYGPQYGLSKGLPLHVIRKSLRWRDYRRIRVRDGQLPVYKFKACRNGKRFMLFVNRWGKIMHRERRGFCFPNRFGHRTPLF